MGASFGNSETLAIPHQTVVTLWFESNISPATAMTCEHVQAVSGACIRLQTECSCDVLSTDGSPPWCMVAHFHRFLVDTWSIQ